MTSVPLPAPPPALPAAPPFSPWAGVLLAAVFLFLFGLPWLLAGPSDWLGAGACAALLLCALSRLPVSERPRRAAALALSPLMVAALLRLGGPFAGAPQLEVLAAAGVGTTMAFGGTLVAFWGAPKDRTLAAALILCGALALGLAGAGRGAAAGLAWPPQAWSALSAAWERLAGSQGLYRWGGLMAAYAVYWIKRTSC